jgi:hypothetical protein
VERRDAIFPSFSLLGQPFRKHDIDDQRPVGHATSPVDEVRKHNFGEEANQKTS